MSARCWATRTQPLSADTRAESYTRFLQELHLAFQLQRKLIAFELELGLLLHRIATVMLQNADQKDLVFNVPLALLYLGHQVFELASQIQIHNERSLEKSR